VFILTAISYCAASAVVALQYLDEQRRHSNNKTLMSTKIIG